LTELAGGDGDSFIGHKADKSIVQLFGQLRGSSVGKAGASALSTIGEKCKLTHDEYRSANVGNRKIHLLLLVLEDPQAYDFLGQFGGFRLGIPMTDAQENQQPQADFAHHLPFYNDFGSTDTLHTSPH